MAEKEIGNERFARELEEIDDALRTAIGDFKKSEQCRQKVASTRNEMKSVAISEKSGRSWIAVVGLKNSGKTWFCKQLMKNPDVSQRLKCGQLGKDSTKTMVWVGDSFQDGIEGEKIPVKSDDMIDLGTPYIMADTPGVDDAFVSDLKVMEKIAGAPLYILMVNSETMESEKLFQFAEKLDGARIFPVCIDNEKRDLVNRGEEDLRKLEKKLARACPSADVRKPFVVPKLDSLDDTEKTEKDLQAQLVSRLGELLNLPPKDVTYRKEALLARLKREIINELKEPLNNIQPYFDELVTKETEAVSAVITELVGTDKQLEIGLRIRMRMRLADETSILFFPFGALLGLFAITTKAWDRIFLSLIGSVPSLAVLGLQTARNITKLKTVQTDLRKALRCRADRLLTEQLSQSSVPFERSVHDNLNNKIDLRHEDHHSSIRLAGLTELESKSTKIFEDAVDEHKKEIHNFLYWSGGIATILFWGLASGPIIAIYREFLSIWYTSCTFGLVKFNDFPIPSPSVFFASLTLIILPITIISMLTLSLGVQKKHIDKAIKDVKKKHDAITKETPPLLHVESNDPIYKAVRYLLRLAKEDPRNPDRG